MTRKTLDQHIETRPDIAGGKPRIAGHRITVRDIVLWHERLGKSVDEIASDYGLTLADVHAALAYYFDHRADIAKPNNYDYSDGMAYSRDFRRKVLAVRNKEGLTIAEAAARFDVGSASVVRWIKNVERKPQGARRRKIDLEALRQDVMDYPDSYQHERAQRFGVAQNAIFFALKKLQLTYKKNASVSQGGRRRTGHLQR